MAKQDRTVRQAADELGTSVKWVRKQIAAGTISPTRRGSKHNGRFALTADEVALLAERLAATAAPEAGTGPEAASDAAAAGDAPDALAVAGSIADAERATLLARIDALESDRTNLQAHVAWARAIAKEQQKALDLERDRTQKLADDLELQRARVEALKALSTIDRLLGRHKAI